jgi:hypothetical protein
MRKRLLSILALSILLASTLVGCGGGGGQTCTLTMFAITGGDVSVMKAGTGNWTEAQVGMSLERGDAIRCGDNSTAEITFRDGSAIDLEAGTEIEVDSLACADTGPITLVIKQTIGSIVFRVTKVIDPASRYEVETPTGVAGVRGSAMWVYVIEDGTTWITNLEGDIWAVAQSVELQIPQGQQCIIRPDQPPKLVMVAASIFHTVGLKSDGTVVAAGDNSDGRCNVNGWTGIVQVSAGADHTVGLESDGTVVAVGDDSSGQCDVDNWTGITQAAAGYVHTLGLKSDGTVVAVGDNTSGQCDVDSWTDIIQVVGSLHTVGLESGGTVVAVGWNLFGQCNVSTWTGIVQVAGSFRHTVGLKADGTVVAAGDNSSGQCNVGGWTGIVQVSAGDLHTVGLKADGTVVAVGDNSSGQCDVSTWADIVQVVAGSSGWHTLGLKSDGTVVAVGDNSSGQCDVSTWDLK